MTAPDKSALLQPIPDEWLVLALSAAAGRALTTDVHDLIDYSTDMHEAMAHALAAVQGPIMRAVEQRVRAQVADEIRAELVKLRSRIHYRDALAALYCIDISDALEAVDRIARGDQ